jgi:hypothetical protein
MSKNRMRRPRRPRLLKDELAPGESLPPHELYLLPNGTWTRNQQFALLIWTLEDEGLHPLKSSR